ncbi:prepilin-type N-terminal cleavage/methylation domain-containing protein [Elusimicrobium posterum]|uniref:type IV pilin protein n=1 Tax=Elusimicrobium posterum TaxID=3116653 RepID=UPI003C73CC5D
MKKGFTLIELLVVVLIIGILASIALPQYMKAVEKARSVEAITTLKALTDSFNRYYLEHGTYKGSDGTIKYDELDLDFTLSATGKTVVTKSFNYGTTVFNTAGTYIIITVLPNEKDFSTTGYYTLAARLQDGAVTTRTCTDVNRHKLCKSYFPIIKCEGNYCHF